MKMNDSMDGNMDNPMSEVMGGGMGGMGSMGNMGGMGGMGMGMGMGRGGGMRGGRGGGRGGGDRNMANRSQDVSSIYFYVSVGTLAKG